MSKNNPDPNSQIAFFNQIREFMTGIEDHSSLVGVEFHEDMHGGYWAYYDCERMILEVLIVREIATVDDCLYCVVLDVEHSKYDENEYPYHATIITPVQPDSVVLTTAQTLGIRIIYRVEEITNVW